MQKQFVAKFLTQFALRVFSLFWLISAAFFSDFSEAGKIYPWVDVPIKHFLRLKNSSTEQMCRERMIDEAEDTLDIITFDQKLDDEWGKPILDGILRAANRGVKVRIMTAWISSVFDEKWSSRIADYLKQHPTRVPIEYLIVGGGSFVLHGFLPQDTVHEKIILKDRKHEDKAMGAYTGRGHDGQYRFWVDEANVFRGALVQQFAAAFEELWGFVKPRHASIVQDLVPSDLVPVFPKQPPALQERLKDRPRRAKSEVPDFFEKENRKLQSWLEASKRSLSTTDLQEDSGSSQGYRMRLIHHNLLAEMDFIARSVKSSPHEFGTSERLAVVQDPFLKTVIESVKETQPREFRYTVLAMTLNPKLKEFLMEQLALGLKVKIFTNSKEAHSEVVPYPAAWYGGLEEMADLVAAGAEIYVLKPKDQTEFLYVHQKTIITDRRTFIGSNNGLKGQAHTDEMSIEIDSEAFAQESAEDFDQKVADHGRLISASEIAEDMGWSYFLWKKLLFRWDWLVSVI